MTSKLLLQYTFILQRPRAANFTDIKISTMFLNTTFKDSKTNLKELETMY